MMNNQEFENLVFERAEIIKKRDRNKKIIRLTVMPIAAAVAVMTAVGVSRMAIIPNLNDSTGMIQGETNRISDNVGAAAQYTQESDEMVDKSADAAYTDDVHLNDNTPGYSISYSDEFSGDALYEAPEDDLSDISLIEFVGQSHITVTDENSILEIEDALATMNEEADETSGGCYGTLSVTRGDTVTNYRIYRGYAEVYSGNDYEVSLRMTNEVKEILEKYFEVSV